MGFRCPTIGIRASRLEIPGIRDRPSGFDEQKDGDAGIVACTEDGCKVIAIH
jgi:hypothetical protein